MFGKLRLTSRIGVGFGTLILTAVVMGGVAVLEMRDLHSNLDEIFAQREVGDAVSTFERYCVNYLDFTEDWILTRDVRYLEQAEDSRERLTDQLRLMSSVATPTGERELANLEKIDFRLNEHWRQLTRGRENYDTIKGLRYDLGGLNESFLDLCRIYREQRLLRQPGTVSPDSIVAPDNIELGRIDLVTDRGRNLHEAWLLSAGDARQSALLTVAARFNSVDFELAKLKSSGPGLTELNKLRRLTIKSRYALGSMRSAVEQMTKHDKDQAATVELIRKEVRDLIAQHTDKIDMLALGFNSELQSSVRSTMIGIALVTCLGFIFSLLVVRAIAYPIRELSVEVNGETAAVAEAVKLIEEADADLRLGGDEQVASIHASVRTIAGLALSNRNDTAGAREISRLLTKLTDQTRLGDNAIATLKENLDEASDATRETGGLAKAVDEISLLAKLLAMNSSREFESIRANLEKDSGPKETRTTIDGARKVAKRAGEISRRIVELTSSVLTKIEAGRGAVASTDVALASVNATADEVQDMADRLIKATESHSGKLDQLVRGLHHIEAAARHQVIGAAETSDLAGELSERFGNLQTATAGMMNYVDRSVEEQPEVILPAERMIKKRPAEIAWVAESDAEKRQPQPKPKAMAARGGG
ncbi:MAG: hypothetical protein GY835_11255 [bacterium]|nr:hypothetical protein [bacterium]